MEEYGWNMAGICHAMDGILMEDKKNIINGIRMQYGWDMNGIWMAYGWHMDGGACDWGP